MNYSNKEDFFLRPENLGSIYIRLSRGECDLARYSLIHYQTAMQDQRDLDRINAFIKQIDEALDDSKLVRSPYFELLEMGEEDANHLHNALHLLISESGHAKEFGDMADRDVGDKKLNYFADFRHILNEMISQLEISSIVWHHEKRIAQLENKLSGDL